ncbi:MAG: BtrH N-terminal domain-containing protein [bacterium]|nr:BtrH N-terminal domain-containing protein [bacterium]
MPFLNHYTCFGGVHWETASLHHALAYQGIVVPHTGQPISEALLFGISGGAAIGYFSFAYQGYMPHVALLTRNTFDPVQHLCERLGIIQTVKQTTNPDKGLRNLIETLEDGHVPILSADLYSLPYNSLPKSDGMWVFMPLVVFGVDDHTAHIADLADVPLEIPLETLQRARTRTKDNKSRLTTVELPDLDRLPRAVEKGIHACLSLYLETPPKGSKNNFGFEALDRWIDLLTRDKDKQSWGKLFTPGRAMYNGLVTAFNGIQIFGTNGGASRTHYADFLDEASVILGKDGLKDTAEGFRRSASEWEVLANTLLPDAVAPFKGTRDLLLRKQTLFKSQGITALAEIEAISARLEALHHEMENNFPLDEAAAQTLKEQIAAQVMRVRDTEREAVRALEQTFN